MCGPKAAQNIYQSLCCLLSTAVHLCNQACEGVDAVIVSNHGGRQMDGTLGSIEALSEVVAACKGGPYGPIEVFLDGGVRRGKDIFKALALGAQSA
eukprot:SAG31_NODE_136_length_23089_cov_8.825924_22_plen_96_part_00